MIGTCHIVVAMKPLCGNFVQNALKYGVSGLNIDGTRIPTSESLRAGAGGLLSNVRDAKDYPDDPGFKQNSAGRWPSNVILGNSEEIVKAFPVMHAGGVAREKGNFQKATTYFGGGGKAETGHRFGDTGSASRFFKQVNEFVEPSERRTV